MNDEIETEQSENDYITIWTWVIMGFAVVVLLAWKIIEFVFFGG